MKKVICILFVFIILAFCAVPAFTASRDWTFDTRTGTLYIWRDYKNESRYNKPEWEDLKPQIKTIVCAYGVTTINEYAFWECENLNTVFLSSTLKEIRYEAFRDCVKLRNIYLPYGLQKIGWNAFENCYSLRQINIPSTVTYIGDFAFGGCKNLYYITIPSSVTMLGNYVFEGSSIRTIIYTGNYRQWQAIEKGYHSESVDKCFVMCLNRFF